MARSFRQRRLVLLALLPISAGAWIVQPLGVRAQACDATIMSCPEGEGGMTYTPIQSPLSSEPTATVVAPSLKPAESSAHDACVDRADAAYLRCSGSVTVTGALGAAAAGALGGAQAGPAGAGAGAVVGASGFAVGKAIECLGGYVADLAACPSP